MTAQFDDGDDGRVTMEVDGMDSEFLSDENDTNGSDSEPEDISVIQFKHDRSASNGRKSRSRKRSKEKVC